MLFLIPPFLVLVWVIVRFVYILVEETIDDYTKGDVKADYLSMSMDISEEFQLTQRIISDEDFKDEVVESAKDELKEIAGDDPYIANGIIYMNLARTTCFSDSGMPGLYALWIYCAKKGRICYSCGIDKLRYRFYFKDLDAIYLKRYLKAMEVVEKIIQEKYPEQQIIFLGDKRVYSGTPEVIYEGALQWEAGVTRKEKSSAGVVQKLW